MKTPQEFISILTGALRRVRMQPRIREALRERLASYADMHEVPTRGKERFSLQGYFALNFFRVGFALLVIVLGAGGVAYASYDTVPGNVLYPIKVSVVEPLESTMLTDARSRATWNAILAERRLEEAATLASRGALTQATREELQDRFEYHATESSAANAEVRATGDVLGALALRSDLEARISAHADLFSYLALRDGEESEPRRLLSSVARVRDAVAAERKATEAEAYGRVVAYDDRSVDALETATNAVAARAASADGAVSGNIEARITAARSAIDTARTAVKENNPNNAFVAGQTATRFAQEASILAKSKEIVGATLFDAATTTDENATTTEESVEEGEGAESEDASSSTQTPSPETNAQEVIDSVINLIGL